jgi:hypothetical protein
VGRKGGREGGREGWRERGIKEKRERHLHSVVGPGAVLDPVEPLSRVSERVGRPLGGEQVFLRWGGHERRDVSHAQNSQF